jgi:hypothetical protein
MRIAKGLVAELAVIMKQEFGMELTPGQSEEMAEGLITVFTILASCKDDSIC